MVCGVWLGGGGFVGLGRRHGIGRYRSRCRRWGSRYPRGRTRSSVLELDFVQGPECEPVVDLFAVDFVLGVEVVEFVGGGVPGDAELCGDVVGGEWCVGVGEELFDAVGCNRDHL